MTPPRKSVICRWCDEPATDTRVVVPADVNRRTGEVRRPGVEADVCDKHAAMVDREVRCRDLEKVIHRAGLALQRTTVGSGRHKQLVGELDRARLELAELNT